MTWMHITIMTAVTLPFVFTALLYALLCFLDVVFYPRAIDEFRARNLPDADAAVACFDRARNADQKVRLYDATAPLVMLVALLFTPRSANRLPNLFRKWDNDVSINGDGCGWQRADGTWVDLRDGVRHEGEPLIGYDDPAYGGTAYYAKGHHPRSYWARYIWLGWRNRASKLSQDLGIVVRKADIELLAGDMNIGTRQEGHFLLRRGDDFHYKSVRRIGRFVLIRSIGYKLEIRYKSDRPDGPAAAVLIPISLKRWKGAEVTQPAQAGFFTHGERE